VEEDLFVFNGAAGGFSFNIVPKKYEIRAHTAKQRSRCKGAFTNCKGAFTKVPPSADVFIYIYISLYLYIYICLSQGATFHLLLDAYIYIYISLYLYIYIYVFIRTYVHT
jgi:hypothetical protein